MSQKESNPKPKGIIKPTPPPAPPMPKPKEQDELTKRLVEELEAGSPFIGDLLTQYMLDNGVSWTEDEAAKYEAILKGIQGQLSREEMVDILRGREPTTAKNCYHCGNEPGMEGGGADSFIKPRMMNKDKHSVMCFKCGMKGPEMDTKRKAIEAWNKIGK